MFKLYIDAENIAYLEPAEGRREVETMLIDESTVPTLRFRFVPFGESWAHKNGTLFYGEMVALAEPPL